MSTSSSAAADSPANRLDADRLDADRLDADRLDEGTDKRGRAEEGEVVRARNLDLAHPAAQTRLWRLLRLSAARATGRACLVRGASVLAALLYGDSGPGGGGAAVSTPARPHVHTNGDPESTNGRTLIGRG